MSYITLKKLYYTELSAYEASYQERFHSEYAHHIDFQIGKANAFFVVTPQIQKKMLAIQKADKTVFALCEDLPPIAIQQFSKRCLIDEIVLTNNIEGVHSTRREIGGVLSNLEQQDKRGRFHGLVKKYMMLQARENIPIYSCEDVRQIYDDLALKEVLEDDPNNMPDGKIFRKGSVSVQSPSQKEIHQGVYPEENIIATMTQALKYLNDESEELLYRTAVFHYLVGYIHPFYDGNGRLNRFISSYMLTKELEPVLSYRLSYTIKENLDKYYEAFKECNHYLNRGDLTPFVEMFLDVIEKSVVLLVDALEKREEQLQHYVSHIEFLPKADDSIFSRLYDVLIQAQLFSEQGISTQELLAHLGISRETLRRKLEVVDKVHLLKQERIKKEKFYGIDLEMLDKFIAWRAEKLAAEELEKE